MSDNAIVITLKAAGENQVRSVFKGVGKDASDAGKEIEKAGEKVSAIDAALRKVKGNAFADSAKSAKDFSDNLDEANKSLEGLNDRAEKVRNFGAGLAAAGVAGLALSNSFIQAAKEGEGIEQRLESILKQQQRFQDLDKINAAVGDITVRGHFADDDEIRNSSVLLASFSVQTQHMAELMEDAARQARTMGTDVGQVAEQLGKAYNTGQVAMLKRSGVTIDQADIDKIEKAYKISKEFGQQTFIDVVGPAIKNNTVALEDSLTAAQAAANDAARAYDDFATAVGHGSQAADAEVKNLATSLLGLVTTNETVAHGFGWVLTMGSYLASGVGTLVTFGSQLVILRNGITAFNVAKAAQTAATAASATAAATEAGAVTAAGAASAAGGAAAGGAATGFAALSAAIWPVTLALIALAAAWVAWQGTVDSKSMTDTDLKKKWGPLGSWWADRGRAMGDDSEAITDDDRKGLELENKARAKRGQRAKTMEEYKGHSTAEDASSVGAADDPQAAVKAAMEQLKSAGAATVAPSAPSVMSAASAASGGLGDDEYTSRIRGLEDAIRSTDDPALKKKMQGDLIQLKRDKQDVAKLTREQKAADKEKERAAKELLQARVKEADRQADELIAALQADTQAQVDALEEAKGEDEKKNAGFDRQIKDIQARSKEREAEIRAGVTALTDKAGADSSLRIAQIGLRSSLASNASAERRALKDAKGEGVFRGFGMSGLGFEASGGMFNPYGAAAAGPAFATVLSGPAGVGYDVPQVQFPQSQGPRSITARIGNMKQVQRGLEIAFEKIFVEDRMGPAMDALPGGAF